MCLGKARNDSQLRVRRQLRNASSSGNFRALPGNIQNSEVTVSPQLSVIAAM
jgi:hypothetical protein